MADSANVVLVVEDEFLVRLTASELLADAGFTVLEAANADAALATLEANSAEIQVLLTDVRMPGTMDGAELACLTRREWPWIKILVVSGNLTPPSAAMPPGCDFLAKPYNPHELVGRIISLLKPETAVEPQVQVLEPEAPRHPFPIQSPTPAPAYLS